METVLFLTVIVVGQDVNNANTDYIIIKFFMDLENTFLDVCEDEKKFVFIFCPQCSRF